MDIAAVGGSEIPRDLLAMMTVRAQAVLAFATEEARRFNHNYVGTEHLLLGVARDKDSVAARVLRDLGVELTAIREQVDEVIGRGPDGYSGDAPMTPRTQRVLQLADEERHRLGHVHIGTEHLLIGLVREGEGIAARILVQLGADLTAVRRRLDAAMRKDTVISCRLNGRDIEAIDMLIEAGIRSTRSDAASWLISAGIEANQDMFRRVRTTVDEIRRLRDEAQTMAREWIPPHRQEGL